MRTVEKAILNRTALLVGDAAMERIAAARVIIFGVGGVGSWCAESLVRSGIRQLTIVDSDRVCITNVNRQAMATTRTVGRVKVEALKELPFSGTMKRLIFNHVIHEFMRHVHARARENRKRNGLT